MPRSPMQKRMMDPAGLGTPKLFKDRRKSKGEPVRDKPLEGLKKTLPSENDGQLKDMMVARTLVFEPCRTSKILGVATLGLSIFVLVLSCTIIMPWFPSSLLWIVSLLFWGGFLLLHLCAIGAQVMSGCKNSHSLLGLGILYGGWILWFLIEGFFQ